MTENKIGTLNEKALHAALKAWYVRPGDQFEVPVDNFVIDIVRGDLLIEIQTQSFSAIKRKLQRLVTKHRVRLVYPIAQEKWIVKQTAGERKQKSRRKSPKRGVIEELFIELVSLPGLLADPNFSLEVLMIQEEEVRRIKRTQRWRRKRWAIQERRLIQVLNRWVFENPADMAELIPSKLTEPFTTADLAHAIGRPRWLAQKMAYCLREMGVIAAVGKQGNAILYTRSPI